MTKALASFPEDRRTAIATRRLNNGVNSGARGNGFWGAKDYFVKKGMRLPGKLGTEQSLMEALRRMQDGSGFSTEATRDRRHTGDGPAKGNRFGKPSRREDGATEGKPSHRRDKHGVGVPAVRKNFSRVGGGRAPSKRNDHQNRPRLVRSSR